MKDERDERAARTPVVLVGSIGKDDRLLRILSACNCDAHAASTLHAALAVMRERVVPVILCEHELPDGTWTDLLSEPCAPADRPILIVTSRMADDHLWVEVLNLGGYDVLSQPFIHREVAHVINSAWRTWQQQQLQRTHTMKAGSAGSSEKGGSLTCSPA